MQDDYNQQFIKNRHILMEAVSKAIREQLKNTDKSLKLFSREYDFSDGQLSKLLREKYSDIKLSTLWKLANSLNIAPSKFIDIISKNLPENFNFYD